MAVLIRKKGKGEYAYLVAREGKRVAHRYLGLVGEPRVASLIATEKDVLAVPQRLRSLFWDVNPERIHIRRNARYIIERVLEFGDIDAIGWLQRAYPVRTIVDVLFSSRSISERSRDFWLLWFGVEDA